MTGLEKLVQDSQLDGVRLACDFVDKVMLLDEDPRTQAGTAEAARALKGFLYALEKEYENKTPT
jgi:hypothetical protein